ncbi:MAG TPA: arginine decarboxylase, pyruvoyl-dependent [Candidatus Hydrogenedentes bacterium]|mgnify:CR=1 FL=1|nr:arginine decarboxylase, pyruvoyl-dependent [Candidatus Hydrogenedentota bacterium]
MYVPTRLFFTRGVGKHKEKLASFEMALRAGGIAQFNLVRVSSILPPKCKILKRGEGLKLLKAGQIVHTVMAEAASNEPRRLLAAAIGVAVPRDPEQFGYLSEYHGYGVTDNKAGDYAEDLAAEMFATVMGLDFDPDRSWDEKREIWRISGKFLNTRNIVQSALVDKEGLWTTTVAAAVLIP